MHEHFLNKYIYNYEQKNKISKKVEVEGEKKIIN
jgi:hypothetical protein